MHVFYVKLIRFTPVTTIRTTINISEPLILIMWYYCITLTYPVEMFMAGTEMYLVKIFTKFFLQSRVKGFLNTHTLIKISHILLYSSI